MESRLFLTVRFTSFCDNPTEAIDKRKTMISEALSFITKSSDVKDRLTEYLYYTGPELLNMDIRL